MPANQPARFGANTMTTIAMDASLQTMTSVGPRQSALAGESSDAQLMAQLARGEMNALGTLVCRHQDHVRDLAFRMTRRHDLADDITQETFLRVLKSAGRYRPGAAFTTWLYRIVANLCLDAARKPRLAALVDAETSVEDCPRLEVQERRQAVSDAIDELPERQKLALILHRFREMSLAQIAQVSGWSPSAVESLLVRAYASLREKLKEWKC